MTTRHLNQRHRRGLARMLFWPAVIAVSALSGALGARLLFPHAYQSPQPPPKPSTAVVVEQSRLPEPAPSAQHPADVQPSLAELEERARSGDTAAMLTISHLHREGTGVDPDPDISLKYLIMAAEKGERSAYLPLADAYWDHPKGRDAHKAIHWYERAAAQGDTIAMNRLAHIHHDGIHVEKDLAASLSYLGQAAATGSADIALLETLQREMVDSLKAADRGKAALEAENRRREQIWQARVAEQSRRHLDQREREEERRRAILADIRVKAETKRREDDQAWQEAQIAEELRKLELADRQETVDSHRDAYADGYYDGRASRRRGSWGWGSGRYHHDNDNYGGMFSRPKPQPPAKPPTAPPPETKPTPKPEPRKKMMVERPKNRQDELPRPVKPQPQPKPGQEAEERRL